LYPATTGFVSGEFSTRHYLNELKTQENVSHFLVAVYYLLALDFAEAFYKSRLVQRQFYIFICSTLVGTYSNKLTLPRRMIMAKGQQRKNKEVKKPKKQPVPAKVTGNRQEHGIN
jgi:hypothetical protein